MVIIVGAHYCSRHALDVTLSGLAGRKVIDLRSPELRSPDQATPRVVAMAS